ncbi:hypothetical protein [Rhodococcoides kroppenstedtii]|uniref:hypothetical protein n=1 Tax=Rhodococcoides kroppenstedtii TaxID=293050 RepID=UPI0028E3D19C|nr:hypothetical protein [Rhodococcus kroppenstedtii]
MAVNVELEFRLLYDLDDDWMPFWGFMAMVTGFWGTDTPPEKVAGVIRWFAETGLVTLGALADNEYGWEEWDVDLDESMERIANGTASGVGYDQAAGVADLMTTEVFRANITEKGERRLAELEEQGLTYWTTQGPYKSPRG